MEILRHAIFAAERDHVAPQFLLAAVRGDFGDVGSGLPGVPIGRDRRLARSDRDADRRSRRAPSGPTTRACTCRIAGGQVSGVANLGAQMHMPVVVQHRARRGSHHARRRVAHQPAQHLTPEYLMAHVLHRLQHLPAPVAAGGEHRGAAAPVLFGDQQRHGCMSRRPSFRPAPARPAWACPLPESSSYKEASSSAPRWRRDSLRCA